MNRIYWENSRGYKLVLAGGPFLESPGNFPGPKSNIQIGNVKSKSAGPANQTTPFCFINWQFYHVRCKTIETSIFNVNGDSLPGLLIIGTFEKRAPELLSKHLFALRTLSLLESICSFSFCFL